MCALLLTVSLVAFGWLRQIGAGAIELAGHVPQNFWQRGQGAQQNLVGTYKRIKKINEKAKYSAKEVSVSSLGNGHTLLTLCCGGSIHSCPIVHSKLPTEANSLRLDHCCSAFHKAPFWGHYCTFCTLPNSNMWSHSMARVYTSRLMTANFTFMWQSATL